MRVDPLRFDPIGTEGNRRPKPHPYSGTATRMTGHDQLAQGEHDRNDDRGDAGHGDGAAGKLGAG